MLIWIGYDPKEKIAHEVTTKSVLNHCEEEVRSLKLESLKDYRRPLLRKQDGTIWDVISDHPMSTEFALTRFFVPKSQEVIGLCFSMEMCWYGMISINSLN